MNNHVCSSPRISRKYDIHNFLGAGGFGTVYLIKNKENGKNYALKLMPKSELIAFLTEGLIMSQLKCPHLTRLEDHAEDPKHYALVMDYMSGGNLRQRLNKNQGRLSSALAKLYFFQMCTGVNFLHAHGVTHRDLKPENLLLASEDECTLLKVTDFGLSKTERLETVCGTPPYMAPEVFQGRGYTSRVDSWSLGIILYECLSGARPRQILDFPGAIWKNEVSERPKTLLRQLLRVEPLQRSGTTWLLAKEPWLHSRDLEKLTQSLLKAFAKA